MTIHRILTVFILIASSAGGLLWLSGCRVTHREPQVAAFIPEQFSAAPDRPQGDPLPQKWWESFGDASLNELIERAMGDNFSIRSAWDRLSQAEQVAAKTGVRLLPTLSYSAGYTRSHQETGPLEIDTDRYSAGLSASYELDIWGEIRSEREAARLDVLATEQSIASAAMTLSAGIAKIWYQLADSAQFLSVLNDQLETNRKILDLITFQAQNGKAGSADVYRQRQLIENTQGLIVQARQRDLLLQHQLAILIGIAPGAHWQERSHDLPDPGVLPALAVPADILQNRPDVQTAWLQIKAADLRVNVAQADRYPSLTLSAGVSTSSEKLVDLFDDWLATLAGTIAGPLFDAGLRQIEVERTRAVLSQRLNDYRQTLLTALKEVEDALVNEDHQRKYLLSLQEQLKLANQVYDRTRQQYLGGQLDYIRVLESLVSQQNLQRSLVTARRQLVEYRVDLCRAIASGWLGERPESATMVAESEAADR